MPKDNTVVEVKNLQMRYGDNVVLDGVDFAINKGEILVLLGPNGAGKTTTIEVLEGFRGRSGGEIKVLGVDPDNGDEEWRSRIGVVLQSWRDHSKWEVRSLLNHLGKYYIPYSTPERKRPFDTDDLLDKVGLAAHANKKVSQLSGGQRRRLDVAIGLVGNPELLFLDEPTVGFDPKARREFHDVIHTLSDLAGTTILLTTHDLDEAEKLSDRIIILAGGKIVADGSVDVLAQEVAGKTEVIWTQDGKRNVHPTTDATNYTRKLLTQHKDGISKLEIRRASLEDTYMTIVQKHENAKIAKEKK
ncbi:MAG TPA: ABC transporter ATP-binding protein [Candidatus Saccharimonadales bacterium]|nr:ABC transporter ATP-binding protein [Candidatus Saccharimonadales bacterium]